MIGAGYGALGGVLAGMIEGLFIGIIANFSLHFAPSLIALLLLFGFAGIGLGCAGGIIVGAIAGVTAYLMGKIGWIPTIFAGTAVIFMTLTFFALNDLPVLFYVLFVVGSGLSGLWAGRRFQQVYAVF